jgi:polyether ionophore transport system permease protein
VKTGEPTRWTSRGLTGHPGLTGIPPLLKVALHQDARNIAPWVVLISALSASSILAYAWIFPDPEDRAELATTLAGNPALSVIFGPARDLTTPDGFNAWRAGQLGALFAGLMAILIVIRNSRADEDSGQAELIASGVIARTSRLAVAVLIAAVASVALGVGCFLVTIACGGGLASTLVLAATFTASGLMFAGLAGIAAQLGSEARTANSIAIATLGACYVVRGYIDSSAAPDWVSWLTPLGWLERTHPGTDHNAWPLLLALVLAVVLGVAAFALQGRRDFGQGLIAPRRGRADAGVAGNVWGLAVKLNRGALVTWLVALTGIGLIFGNLATSIGDIIADNPAMAKILASGAVNATSLTFAFIATILQIIAIVASVMGIQVVLRIHSEEVDYRVEPLLAGSLRRSTYLASNTVIALLGPTAALLLAGTALGLVAHARKESIALADVVRQALVTTPAVWTLIALALAAVGAAPTRRLIAWLAVVATFGLTILGPTFKLPDWALDISPLRHVPNVTAASPDWAGLAQLALVLLLFLAVGFAGFRHRDVL